MIKIKKASIKYIEKVITHILKYYAIYASIFGVIIFGFYKYSTSKYLDTHPVSRFWGDNVCQDRVVLVEERYDSFLARINIIESAEETLDISCYTINDIKDGVYSNVFLGCILDAADRGVQVRFIRDGFFYNLSKHDRDIIYAFSDHPNIEFKLYEPLSLLRPWTWNNKLHDKFIIMDNKLAILGGRNIGNRFFAEEGYKGDVVDDRDVVIINTKPQNFSNSVVCQIKDYFNHVWDHDFSKVPIKKLTERQQIRGQKEAQRIKQYTKIKRDANPDIFNHSIDWMGLSLPANKVTLIHNPIQRFNKEPWCWYEITNLMKTAKESIFVQSPYIIPTNKMQKYLKGISVAPDNIHILTNSLASTPNVMAYSGYMNHRKSIVDLGVNIYEYQGPGSVHAKSYIFDDRISLVGSFNIDSRSAYLSTETMVVIDSKEFAKHLKSKMEDQVGNSLKVARDYSYVENFLVKEEYVPFIKKVTIRLLSVVMHFFEYML